MNHRLKTSLLFLLFLSFSAGSFAEGVAKVTHLSGTVASVKAEGGTRILSADSSLEVGELVSTEKDSYAMLQFSDGGQVTLRPYSRVKIEKYAFQTDKPEEDSFVFSLIKGGLRSITGAVGKRGNRDAYRLNTATATIGIRGTDYDAHQCQGDCGSGVQDGVYIDVHSGIVNATNGGGSQDFQAGQFGFVQAPNIPPVVLPNNPGVSPSPNNQNNGGSSPSPDLGGDSSKPGCLIK